MRRRRGRNWAMLVVLLALCALFYAITIVKMTQVMNGPRSRAQSDHRRHACRRHRRHGRPVVRRRSRCIALFCAVTGYAGTPQIGPAAAPGANAQTHHRALQCQHQSQPALGLRARCRRRSALPLGEEQLAFYTARNEAGTPVTGVALYNVTPDTVGKYFHKTACFCFNQQTLAAGQQMEFPLSFWVDPAIAKDPEHRGHPHDHAVLHVLPHARRCAKDPARSRRPVRMSVR